MIFPSRSQLASKQITRTGRARAVTKEGIRGYDSNGAKSNAKGCRLDTVLDNVWPMYLQNHPNPGRVWGVCVPMCRSADQSGHPPPNMIHLPLCAA